jgi:hypothetical protein
LLKASGIVTHRCPILCDRFTSFAEAQVLRDIANLVRILSSMVGGRFGGKSTKFAGAGIVVCFDIIE